MIAYDGTNLVCYIDQHEQQLVLQRLLSSTSTESLSATPSSPLSGIHPRTPVSIQVPIPDSYPGNTEIPSKLHDENKPY